MSAAPECFATQFDAAFLPQGLALYRSLLAAYGPKNFRLMCLTLDKAAEKALGALNLAEITALPLARFETEALRAVKPTRSRAEYCWTLTPSIDRRDARLTQRNRGHCASARPNRAPRACRHLYPHRRGVGRLWR